MSIASEIKSRLANKGPANTQDNQAAAAKSLVEKTTGKSAASGARLSNIGQQVSQQAAAGAQEQVRQQGMQQADALVDQSSNIASSLQQGKDELASQARMQDESRGAQMDAAEAQRLAQEDEAMAKLDAQEVASIKKINNDYDQALTKMAADRGIAVDDMFTSFDKEEQELEFRKDSAELDQLAHTMRMKDTAYVDHITRIGKLRGLEDVNAFRKESRRIMLGDDKARLMDELGFLAELNEKDRDFKFDQGIMDLDTAMEIYKADIKAENSRAMIEGGTMVASQAAQGAMNSKSTPDEYEAKSVATDSADSTDTYTPQADYSKSGKTTVGI